MLMGIIGGTIGYRLLQKISPTGDNVPLDSSAYDGKSKLAAVLGERVWDDIAGKVVIDFGCGVGAEAIEMARRGAARVIGVDLQERLLRTARERAAHEGLSAECTFTVRTNEQADVIIAIDSFEHFRDPPAVLKLMSSLLKPTGQVLVAFGPTWYHPLGGHLFSVFPWAHLLFTERALLRWRAGFKDDGATRFEDVPGGLNRMTIARFQRIVADSPFRFAALETVPIRQLAPLANRWTREVTTAIVRCRLVLR